MRHPIQPVVVWRHPFEASARPRPHFLAGNFSFSFRDLIVPRMVHGACAARGARAAAAHDAIVARTAPPPPGVARSGAWPSTGV